MLTIELQMWRGVWKYKLLDAYSLLDHVSGFASAERALAHAQQKLEDCFNKEDNPGIEDRDGWLDPIHDWPKE